MSHSKINAPSTMLRMVPLPRFAGEDPRSRPSPTLILPRLRGSGTAKGGGGGTFRGEAYPGECQR